ncbi:MAG: response regulator [Geobacteraceae bacterium]|nr:response regulator [Geobacteraceae bacterium]NTW79841.1 response regulator [Geobacteraceae bacterium]
MNIFSPRRAPLKSKQSIIKLLGTFAACVACVFAISIPGIYYAISLTSIQKSLETEAAFLAKSIERIIQAGPELWEYESVRLKETISQPSLHNGRIDDREIRNASGNLVAKTDYAETSQKISATAKIFDSGKVAGSITIRHSIRTELITTAILGIFSSFVGFLLFYIFRTYPIRILDNTLTDLQRERDKSDKTLFAIGDGVITLDNRGKILFINRAAELLVGMGASKAVGLPLKEVYCLRKKPDGQDGRLGGNEAILIGNEGKEYTIEEIRTRLTGTEDHEVAEAIVFRDVSERKQLENERQQLEQQFQQTQKLESLGVLAGGIAHDFNNILAIIMGYCSLIKMDYNDAEKHLPEIEKAAERAAALCRQMLAYAGKAQFIEDQVNTCMLVDEMVAMLKTTIKQNVVIRSELCTDIPFITGDASQIRQIVMNLIINAAEAIGEEQGEIHVSLSKREIKAGKSESDHLGNFIPAGQYICLEVTDNGCGMDEETRFKIFEPFYTTKFTGRGLGMSAVLGIITAHKGALQLTSQPGQGTTFKVYLPVQTNDATRIESNQNATSATWKGSGTLLLVEDEAIIRLIVKEQAEKLGLTVIEASNGKEAMELYLKNSAEITHVLTDMDMPVMDGYALFRELKKLNPELPIIISSGFGDAEVTSRIPLEEISGLISKPYNFDQFREVLKKVVDNKYQSHA